MEIEKQIEFKIDILDFQCLNKELVLMWLNYVRFYILVNIYIGLCKFYRGSMQSVYIGYFDLFQNLEHAVLVDINYTQ